VENYKKQKIVINNENGYRSGRMSIPNSSATLALFNPFSPELSSRVKKDVSMLNYVENSALMDIPFFSNSINSLKDTALVPPEEHEVSI